MINELLIQTPRENITNDCSLINDLGLDSLQVLELIVALEVEFAIRIEDEDLNFELFNNITLLARHIDSKVKNV